jgi:hypothetical protein
VQETHAPPWQTEFVPHDVPLATFEVFVQSAAPVEQSIVPATHPSLCEHAAPCVHALHAPRPSQTRPAPHEAPALVFDVLVQVAVPVEQSVVPVIQPPFVEQAAPWVHAPHTPLSHTMPVPHAVPLPTLVPVSTQRGEPIEQSMEPLWHGSIGVQIAPWLHALHAPAPSQTMFAPHGEPAGAFEPVSVHTAMPVEHDVVPTWHAFGGTQVEPWAQEAHAPLLQTRLAPQDVPLVALLPVSMHVEVPLAHEVVPVWHAFVGVHADPAVHAVHAPVSQTAFVPHGAPFGALPVALHVSTPGVAHVAVPTWQIPVGVHVAPCVQATDVDLLAIAS